MSVSIKGVTAKRSTDKALLVVIAEEEMWIPHSQIEDASEVYDEGHSGTLVISDWIAEKKDLI